MSNTHEEAREIVNRLLETKVCDSCHEAPCGYHTTGCQGITDASFIVLNDKQTELAEKLKAAIASALSARDALHAKEVEELKKKYEAENKL